MSDKHKRKNPSPNQSSSSYSPNSIGGRIDDLLREKLMKQTNTNKNENTEKSVQGKGKEKQP